MHQRINPLVFQPRDPSLPARYIGPHSKPYFYNRRVKKFLQIYIPTIAVQSMLDKPALRHQTISPVSNGDIFASKLPDGTFNPAVSMGHSPYHIALLAFFF
jgi:hypothetical protein